MFPGPHFWGETFPFLAAGPSQGSSPFPHVQTESNCSHHWFKLERMGVCRVREGRTPGALEAESSSRTVGKNEGTECTLLCPLARPLLVIA